MTRKRFIGLMMSRGTIQGRVAEACARNVRENGFTYAQAYQLLWGFVEKMPPGNQISAIGFCDAPIED